MTHISRRFFLAGTAGLVVAFSTRAAHASPVTVAKDQVDGFLAIGPDGAVTIYSGKVDLGTGARAALRQIVAEELGAQIHRIALVEGDTALTPDQGPTSGSTGIAVGGMQIRQAAATARQALIAMGAERLGKRPADLEAWDGEIRPIAGGDSVAFADLLQGRAFDLGIDPKAPLKNPDSYRIVGKEIRRPDIPAKMTGKHLYVHEFTVAEMLHGRTIRPPAIGAKLIEVDEKSVAAIPGVVKVVRIGNFLGVVAESEWSAIRAARALKAKWSTPATLPGSDRVYDAMRAARVDREDVLNSRGDPTAAMSAAARTLQATYLWPTQSHASLGPSCAVADVRADAATIWTASQGTHKYRPIFARFLKLPPENVRLIYLDGSGCYGMNGHDDAAADAALLSQAVGKPVRVQWMREDEHGWDPKGPAQILDMKGALDTAGTITAWETLAWLPRNTPGLPAVPLLAPVDAGIEPSGGDSAGLLSLNADPPYAMPNMRATIRWLDGTALRPSNLRAPGKIGNVFAVESFYDELAAAAAADPLAFRKRALTEPRAHAVLDSVAARMNWTARPSPAADRSGAILRGRGIAYVHYKQTENYAAIGAEVEVERATGRIRVTRMYCAHDCGLIISPDGVRAQVEGNILQTVSRTLYEEVTFDKSRVTSTDWSSYPILTFPDAPTLDIVLIDRPHEKPLGAGEAAAAPVAAAIGNAVFDATGIRLRQAPFTPARVKAALTDQT